MSIWLHSVGAHVEKMLELSKTVKVTEAGLYKSTHSECNPA